MLGEQGSPSIIVPCSLSLKQTISFKGAPMKKGFTMIELIFVIVILGILASVAIPKLAATRDDAEVSRAAANIRTMVTDLGAYYTAQGKFAAIANLADTIADTGVRTAATNAAAFKSMSAVENPVAIKGKACFSVTGADDGNGTVTVETKKDGLCAQLWSLPGMKQIVGMMTKDGKTITIDPSTKKIENATIKFGGSNVNF